MLKDVQSWETQPPALSTSILELEVHQGHFHKDVIIFGPLRPKVAESFDLEWFIGAKTLTAPRKLAESRWTYARQ